MNKKTLDILFYISIIVLCISLTSCTSTNRKLETHPTNNLNALEKFWEVLGSGTFDKTKSMFKTTY
jgi:hypothetical protein